MASKKMKTGVFTRGGKPVGKDKVVYPQAGTYDIYGMTSANQIPIPGNAPGNIFEKTSFAQGFNARKAENDAATAEANAMAEAMQALYGPTGGGGSGGGFGVNPAVQQATSASMAGLAAGSYADPYKSVRDYLAGLRTQQQGSLDTGAYKAPTQALGTELGRQYSQAGSNIAASNKTLMDYLGTQTNPFANVTAQTTTVDPQFLETLEQQGVSTVPVTTQFQAQQEAAKASGAQFGNLISILKGLEDQGLVSARTAAGLQQDFANQTLETNRALYGTQIAAQEEAARRVVEQDLAKTIADQAKTESDVAAARGGAQENLLKLLLGGGKLSSKEISQAFGEPLAADAPKTFRAAVSAQHPNFKGTTAEAKKKFPKLAAKYGK